MLTRKAPVQQQILLEGKNLEIIIESDPFLRYNAHSIDCLLALTLIILIKTPLSAR